MRFFLFFPISLFAANILVTGGAGYIGSHTCKELARAGHTPITLDNLSVGHAWSVKWGPLVQGQIDDEELLISLFEAYNIEAVVHFAASTHVGESVQNPAKYYGNNTVGTYHLLEAMRKANVRNLVFSSTCAVYGNPDYLPIDEAHPLRPLSPYGWSKQMSEQMIQDYGQAYGLNYVIFRYFNAAGADKEGDVGEEHEPASHLIPIIFDVVKKKSEALFVLGDDYPTADGTGIRDYVHVSDLAEAHLLAVDQLLKDPESCILNLGNGRGYSVFDIKKAVENITGQQIPYVIKARRAGDPISLVANPKKSLEKLGWRATRSDILPMVLSDWNWHLQMNERGER